MYRQRCRATPVRDVQSVVRRRASNANFTEEREEKHFQGRKKCETKKPKIIRQKDRESEREREKEAMRERECECESVYFRIKSAW